MLVTASLVSFTFGIVRTDTLGWGATGVLVPLIAGVALLAAFLLVEARFAREPLVPLSIFRIGHLRAANSVVLLLYASQFPAWFFLTLYLQQVLHYDAIDAGLAFLPMTLSIFAASTLAPRIVGRFGARRVITTGMLTSAVGLMLLSDVAPGGTYVTPCCSDRCCRRSGWACRSSPPRSSRCRESSGLRAASRRACSTPRGWSAGRSGWPCCRRSRPGRPRVADRARTRWR